MKGLRSRLLLASGLLSLSTLSHADINPILQFHTAARTHTQSCETTECEIPFSELRAQVKVDQAINGSAHSFAANVELVQDFVFDETEVRARELYWDWRGEATQVRTGRQIITWGTGDMLFVNDIFAKDWNAYFSGMPLDFMKKPTDAIKFDWYPDSVVLEAVIARFDEDHLPDDRRFEFPMPSMVPYVAIETPDDKPSNLEYAGKASRSMSGWDVSAYASRSYWRSPALRPGTNATQLFYPRLNTYGASATGQIHNGVFNIEAGYYHSPQDSSGSDPFVPNSQVRLLTGYSHQLWVDSMLGVQFYVEHMAAYADYQASMPSDPLKPKWNRVATLRFTQFMLHQTLTFNMFSYWGLTESDRFLQSTLRYAFNDHLWGEIGTNIFSGNTQGMFGAFDRNDNVYLTVRFAY